nr:tetratricopeptide repeat protein [Leptolyngbya sp. FACHB-321]
MARLHELLQASEGAVISAVAGMGGLGKTQLAVQYAKRNQASYPGGIAWFNGRTGDLATQLVLKAEFALHLPGLQAAKERITEAEALAQWCWQHWQPDGLTLIVLDDVMHWAECRSFLPKADRFRVLVTTRLQALLPNFPTITLEVLHPNEARSLLASLEKFGRVAQDPGLADQLCAGLGYLPLGIELVGCYLASDRYKTLSQVWAALQANGMQDSALERSPDYEMTAERGVKAAFALTWETLSAEARRVARLLSYFALDWIAWDWAEWIMQCVEGETYQLGALKAQLENASLVQIEWERLGWCRLHPLVQQFLRDEERIDVETTGDDALRAAFVAEMIEIASQLPDNPTTKELEGFGVVRSHVQEVAKRFLWPQADADFDWIYNGLARFYQGQALFKEAEAQYAECLALTQQLFQGDHPTVARSFNNLAGLYDSQGRLSEAEPLYVQALAMTKRLFESDHPDLARSLNNLAYLYNAQGRPSEAEPLYVQALAMTKRLFQDDHPTVATSFNNLALLYKAQGRLSEAEPLSVQALAMMQRLFQGDHPDVATNLNNLAGVYKAQGRLSETEPLSMQALAMRQRLFQGDHPDVAIGLNNLASLYYSQGRLSEAEPLYVQALAMTKRLFQGDHPDVATNLNNLAYLYKAQGRLSEAEPLYVQALAMTKRLFQGDHPDLARSLNNLAGVYNAQGQLSEAEPLYVQALAMTKRLFQGDHPTVATNLHNLAALYNAQGRLSEAEPLYVQALAMTKRLFQGDHPTVATNLHNLAALYGARGRLSEAEPLYAQALAMFERTSGSHHPNTQMVRKNLETTRQQMGLPIRSLHETKLPTHANSSLFQIVQAIRRFIRSLLRRLGWL